MEQEYISGTAIDKAQFDMMWQFLQIGEQKSNARLLKEYCEKLRHMMTQKTAGQRKGKPKDAPFEHLSTILNIIIMETMCLYLSGMLDKVALIEDEECGTEESEQKNKIKK